MASNSNSRLLLRRLILVFGDQLNADTEAFIGFDPDRDAVWMAEASEESTHVWTSKQRIAMFLSAMRHFREELQRRGWTVHYRELEPSGGSSDLFSLLRQDLERLRPEAVRCTHPGEWRVLNALKNELGTSGIPHQICEDDHFFCTAAQFEEHAKGRKMLRMEYFYREMRQRTGILMEADGSPSGGQWNFDKENRGSFSQEGPFLSTTGPTIVPDAITNKVIELVNARFANHPGDLTRFQWPVTREESITVLQSFIEARLPYFGLYQDAMWAGEPWLFHSWISAALNLKMLNPREVCAAAEQAWRANQAPLNAVEGFIRQILGWREYVRGIYWRFMPEYGDRNALGATADLPAFYWTGETEYTCLREAITQTLQLGYAHHIQRLMVTGLYALLLGVDPKQLHAWYLAVYVDAVEWVELPNTLGMSQFADGGLMASKPYAATGKYIQRMGNYCQHCPKDPAKRTGSNACPFTTLYWDFLRRHESTLRANPRMSLQVRNLATLSSEEQEEIHEAAATLRSAIQM